MNATRTLALKKEFFWRKGIDYGKETKGLIKKKPLSRAWRRFKKNWKLGRI